ncbi:MAG: 16S rRNA (cytosine(1402)-N(4))-methyltransferase RsmH [Deltaproteobacteria bacterium]|nr:16S rRNA (cytosine(1402)-N(4))-methyltransferase RsmH [Deltaproteobacteria bacterium]
MLHQPVFVKEVLDALQCKAGGIYVDATLGTAGHSLEILKASEPEGLLIGIDRDGKSLEGAKERLKNFAGRVRFCHANYSEIQTALSQIGVTAVDGIVADLGMSSWQLEQDERGFSFMKEGPLDMRMNTQEGPTAKELLRRTNEKELEEILRNFGEERLAKKIARVIAEEMNNNTIQTTTDLANVIRRLYPPLHHRHHRIDPATRTFQALRIWVNDEWNSLRKFLEVAPLLLKEEGTLCILSYHSLEDRLVKHAFRDLAKENKDFKVLTKKPIKPCDAEIQENPRARSAKLRALRRVAI